MVKLIRLKSDQDKLYFNNNIQSDLVLEPNSKIALQNISFKKTVENITVDSTNKKIVYDNGDGDTTINLTESTYDNTDFEVFLSDMKNKLNQSLNSTNRSDIGTEFNVKINSSNKMVVETQYSLQINPTNRFTTVNVDKSDPTAIFKNGGGSAWDANISSNSLLAFDGKNGCGIFRAQIGFLGAAGFGFYIGLSETEPQDMAGDFSPNNCQFVINAEHSGTVYRFVDPGNTTLTNSTLTPETVTQTDPDNDILAIEASEGKIELKIYNASNPAGIILPGTVPREYLGGKPLYPIIGIYNNDCHIKDIDYTYFKDISDSLSTEIDNKHVQLVGTTLTPPSQYSGPQLKSFNFETAAFARSLGYTFRFYDDIVSTMNFIADNSVRFFDDTECYLVEALNLQFKSYDGSKGQEKRRNLLAVIQNIRDRTAPDVLFDSNSVIYIDINNAHPLPLRNLQFRILDSDEGEVAVDGSSNMTILIE
jgi:hypothetical protein